MAAGISATFGNVMATGRQYGSSVVSSADVAWPAWIAQFAGPGISRNDASRREPSGLRPKKAGTHSDVYVLTGATGAPMSSANRYCRESGVAPKLVKNTRLSPPIREKSTGLK